MNHEDLCIELYKGLLFYTRRTHTPPSTLILFSAVDINNLTITTIRIFFNGIIVSISNFAFYFLEKALALTFLPTTILILAISKSNYKEIYLFAMII